MKCVAPNFETTTHPDFEHCSPPGFEDSLPSGFDHSIPPAFAGCAPAEFNYCSPPGFEDLKDDCYVILYLMKEQVTLDTRRVKLKVSTTEFTTEMKHVSSTLRIAFLFQSKGGSLKPFLLWLILLLLKIQYNSSMQSRK